ncbi:ABC transporter permease [Streptomyces sp. NBC_00091]|uniref:ABC transporter permease n=1 Tax=Streptomyces sp. NBC_00091 TaxID=2975648 RepID=UPI00224E055F|nr:ABC transporter permease [Streptomyces sp. NBC_00091]MCX5379753.1 ABC transporter permease [Streptomyces sp. NBC_00091]
MRLFLTAARFQLRLAWRSPDTVQVCVTAPLLTIVFLAISDHAGRADLSPYAVVAPTLMSLWLLALYTAGELINVERSLGTLEGLVAAPARFEVLVMGRMCAVTAIGAVSFAESWLVAGLVFDRWLAFPHPAVTAACVLATGFATAGTASILTSLFVLMPSARIIQNTLSYPFYLLGGVLVPVASLPAWLRPESRAVFLSWSADLLRDSLAPAPVSHAVLRLAVILGLGAIGFGLGLVLLRRVLDRVCRLGTLSQT